MAKLVLREACYSGIQDSQTRKLHFTSEHRKSVREANAKIEKRRLSYASAYKNAGAYLSKS